MIRLDRLGWGRIIDWGVAWVMGHCDGLKRGWKGVRRVWNGRAAARRRGVGERLNAD
jgi:hypothetical protein